MPRIIAKTDKMPHEEWVEKRRLGIGGSDAGTICGLNPYGSLIELWADKTGRMPAKDDNEAMRIGRDLEEYVASRFTEATGKKVRRRNAMFCHDEYDFITANIDREIIGENAGLECKTTSVLSKTDYEGGSIPLHYLAQCRHYMNVMGFEKMYLAVLILGKGFFWYEIPYDKTENEALLSMEVDFWKKHIEPDVRPEPDGSESAARVLEKLYKERQENTIAMFEQQKTADEFMAVKSQIKALEKREEELKQKLCIALDGNTDGLTEGYRISWKEQTKNSIDSKALKAKFPDIYEQFVKQSTSKVFRITQRKDN